MKNVVLGVILQKEEPHAGFEPATFRLLSERSANWANAAIWVSCSKFEPKFSSVCRWAQVGSVRLSPEISLSG